MFANIKIFFNALKSGEKLADAVRAKQWALALTYAQVSIMAAVGVLRAFNITFGGISDEQINVLLGGMVTVGTAAIGMLGVASTDKIGLGGASAPLDADVQPAVQPTEPTQRGNDFAATTDGKPTDVYDWRNRGAPAELQVERRAKNPDPFDDHGG